MKTILNKTAAILALIIGAMAVFAGGKVLLGNDPGYFVIDWLPIYNFSMGIVTALFTMVLLWKNNQYAKTAAVTTLAIHSIVMIVLQTVYRNVVAFESIQAMMIRVIVWSIILFLMFIQSREGKASRGLKETKTKVAR